MSLSLSISSRLSRCGCKGTASGFLPDDGKPEVIEHAWLVPYQDSTWTITALIRTHREISDNRSAVELIGRLLNKMRLRGTPSITCAREVSKFVIRLICCATVCLLIAGINFAAPPDKPQKTSTVSLSVLDSFGHQRPDCHVWHLSSDAPFAKADYSSRFSKYIGEKIPYGYYTLLLKCDDRLTMGPKYLSVAHPQEFFVVAQWRNIGDWVTGLDARLAISVETNAGVTLTDRAWVKIVGVYVDSAEVAKLNSESHIAAFYEIVPGRYLVTLLDEDRIICTLPFEYLWELDAHGRMKLTVSTGGCEAEGMHSIRVLQ